MQGRLALELAREHHPDLVLLDVHLPDIGGHQVLRWLQAEERTAGIPVVLISGDTTPERIERALTAGARASLSKPLDVDRFLAVFDEALAGSPSSVTEW
jgi:CheY-like chemotaxis protein